MFKTVAHLRLPLNLLNLAEDLKPATVETWRSVDPSVVPSNFQVLKVFNSRFYYFTFFCIHLTAMCSASLNPFLYGWLNENISNQVTA